MSSRLLFVATFVFLFLVPVLYFGSVREAVGDWVASYYHVSYSVGFVRRGLVGTLASPFGDVKVFAFWSTLIASVAVALLFSLLTEDRRLWLLFLFSPATALHLGFDVGRYDHFNLALLALSLYLLRRNRYLWAVPLLSVLGVLIHEAYLLYAAPVIVVAAYLKDRRLALVSVLLTLAAATVVVGIGRLDPVRAEELISRGALPGAVEALTMGLRDTVVSNLSYVLTEVVRRPWDLITPFLLLSGYAHLYLRALRRAKYPLPILLAPFSGLLLLIFGYDYPRWASIVITVLFLYVAYLNPPLRPFPRERRLALCLMVTTLLGPLGAGHYAFPLAEALLFGTPPY